MSGFAMAPMSPAVAVAHAWALRAFCGILLVLFVIKTIRIRQLWISRFHRCVRAVLSSFEEDQSELPRELVRKVTVRRQIDFTLAIISILTPVSAVLVSTVMVRRLDDWLSPKFYILSLAFAASVLVQHKPSLLTKHTMILLHATFMLAFAVTPHIYDGHDFVYSRYGQETSRVLISCVLADWKVSLFTNFVVTVSSAARYLYDLPEGYGTLYQTISSELFVLGASVALVTVWDITWHQQVRYEMRLKAVLKGQKPLQALLSSLCDATMELGHDLRIIRAPKLNALLMRSADFTGMRLQDIMPEEDGLRFSQQVASSLEASGDQGAPVQLFPTRLLGLDKQEIEVQFFHTRIVDKEEGDCHYIGVCETVNEFDTFPPKPDGHNSYDRASWDEAFDASDAQLSPARSSAGATECRSAGSDASNTRHKNGELAIDAASEGLEVVTSCATFASIAGEGLIGSRFDAWLKPADFQRFRAWVDLNVTRLRARSAALPPDLDRLTMRSPTGVTCTVRRLFFDSRFFLKNNAGLHEREMSTRDIVFEESMSQPMWELPEHDVEETQEVPPESCASPSVDSSEENDAVLVRVLFFDVAVQFAGAGTPSRHDAQAFDSTGAMVSLQL